MTFDHITAQFNAYILSMTSTFCTSHFIKITAPYPVDEIGSRQDFESYKVPAGGKVVIEGEVLCGVTPGNLPQKTMIILFPVIGKDFGNVTFTPICCSYKYSILFICRPLNRHACGIEKACSTALFVA